MRKPQHPYKESPLTINKMTAIQQEANKILHKEDWIVIDGTKHSEKLEPSK